jgi:hypothetical protein
VEHRVLVGVRQFERQVLDADAAFDLQPPVVARDLEVMRDVLEEIVEAAQARGWQGKVRGSRCSVLMLSRTGAS